MPNFIFATVTIVYALVCLTNESDQEKCTTLESSEDSFKKGDAKGSAEKLLEILREKVAKGYAFSETALRKSGPFSIED